jgi:hypothetical protein
MVYMVPARAFIKKGIQTGSNPLFPNYVGHIGSKPVYDVNVPLESMDDILIRTDRIGCVLFENPAYIFGVFWGVHFLRP